MAEKKISRKELLKAPDEFLTFSERVFIFVRDNSKKVFTGVALIVAAVVITVGVLSYLEIQSSRAAEAYATAVARLPVNGEFEPQKAEAAVIELEKVADSFSSHSSGRCALLDLGALYFKLGKHDQSLTAYQRFLDSIKPEEVSLKPLVLDSLAYVYEAKGEPAQAAARWEALIGLQGLMLKEQAYLNLARVSNELGRPDQARQAYQKLLAEFPNSAQAVLAKAQMAALPPEK